MAGNYWTWDDYLRLANNRGGRQCVQPEVCRNFNFGAQVRKARMKTDLANFPTKQCSLVVGPTEGLSECPAACGCGDSCKRISFNSDDTNLISDSACACGFMSC